MTVSRSAARSEAAYLRYALHGVVVASDVQLPLLQSEPTTSDAFLRVEGGAARAEVSIAEREVVYRLHRDDGTPLWTVARVGDTVLFRIHGDADFEIDRGVVRCYPVPGASAGRVEQLLIDQVVPRALHLMGRPCLHGSAVARRSGGAIAFIADTGAGKSTLTAALVDRGGHLLCDDAVAPVLRAGEVFIPPSYPSMRVWSDSAHALYGHDDFPVAARHRKCRVSATSGVPTKLSAVCLLVPDETTPPRVEPLAPSEGLKVVAEAVHRLLPDDLDASAKEFEMLSSLVASVPIHRLHFLHDFDQLASVCELVERL